MSHLNAKAILAILRSEQERGHGTLTRHDVETLEALARSHAKLVEALKAMVESQIDTWPIGVFEAARTALEGAS